MNKKGFTLIELLIVVVIIGILAAIAIPRFGETRERAYISAMQSDLNQVRTAQEMFYQDNNFEYASTTAELTDADLYSATDGVTITVNAGDGAGWDATATHGSTDVACDYDSDVGTIDCAVPAG
ncbi:MAG: prepilin-type N-terminal cleavage/methylation domain-containing protein [Gemmatimonadota bacterium]